MFRRELLSIGCVVLAGCAAEAQTDEENELAVRYTVGPEIFRRHGDTPPRLQAVEDMFPVGFDTEIVSPLIVSEEFDDPVETLEWWEQEAQGGVDADVLLVEGNWPRIEGQARVGEAPVVVDYQNRPCTEVAIAHEIGHALGFGHTEENTIMTDGDLCSARREWSEEYRMDANRT